MKVSRAITVEVDIYDLVNGVVAFAEQSKKETVCPYFWEKLRQAADMMERVYVEPRPATETKEE